jgi:hypothetical protein
MNRIYKKINQSDTLAYSIVAAVMSLVVYIAFFV